jgi:hypothetical protein
VDPTLPPVGSASRSTEGVPERESGLQIGHRQMQVAHGDATRAGIDELRLCSGRGTEHEHAQQARHVPKPSDHAFSFAATGTG